MWNDPAVKGSLTLIFGGDRCAHMSGLRMSIALRLWRYGSVSLPHLRLVFLECALWRFSRPAYDQGGTLSNSFGDHNLC